MFCINCGTSLPEGSNYCYNCGQRQTIQPQINSNNIRFSYGDLVPYEYDEVNAVERSSRPGRDSFVYIILKKGEKVGISDEFFNKIYVPCKYKNIEIFANDYRSSYFKAFDGSKFFLYHNNQLINTDGVDDIFVDGHSPIIYKNTGKYGVITTSPIIVHEAIFDNVKIDSKHGVAITLKDDKYGLISNKGSVLPNRYLKIEFMEIERPFYQSTITDTYIQLTARSGKILTYKLIPETQINPTANSFTKGYYIPFGNIFIRIS